jgi:hypothetical protein
MEKTMFDFISYGESIITFAFFLIALYANKGSNKKIDFLSIITGLMFLYTVFGMPIIQKGKADENIVSYKNGSSLSCTTGFLVYSATFIVKENEWTLEKNYFINKETKESIRVDKCKSAQ